MNKISSSPGSPIPLGANIQAGGINFAIFSRHAEEVYLLLFKSGHKEPLTEISLHPEQNRTGDIWHIFIPDLPATLRYGYRIAGPDTDKHKSHQFCSNNVLLDPYARALSGSSKWGITYTREGKTSQDNCFKRRCCIIDDDFDWQGDKPLHIPLQDSIIYEMHVRGFTRHASSGVENKGTYRGIIEKIPYLQELGITAVELMPVTEFNECENINRNPQTGDQLKNYWGYSPLAFFAPKASLAVNGINGNQVREFKEMVKALHDAGIEVILDIVFNHTAEGDENGPIISFKGLDKSIYYLLEAQSKSFLNFSGCGNTLNCNHPVVRNLILDCLRYWVNEMHVDGFRFDLASILGRDTSGRVLRNAPLIEQIAEDPVLADSKLIAEAWDAAGLYQVGSFSSHPRWAEWNGKFRDDIRSFMAGKDGSVAPLATRICGSADLYQRPELSPFNSINFITSHDGFTLHDLVSFNDKHNEDNGENNRDGDNRNISWNSGTEGPTDDPQIEQIRQRRIKTFACILFLSQGTPMMVAGDEFGRSQGGNNNAYCQDNEISWLDWRLVEKNQGLCRFFKLLIALRKAHGVFRRADFFPNHSDESKKEVIWQALTPGHQDWSATCKTLGFFLNGQANGNPPDDDFFVMLNSAAEEKTFTIPVAPAGKIWAKIIDTAATSPNDIIAAEGGIIVVDNDISVQSMTVVVLISKLTP